MGVSGVINLNEVLEGHVELRLDCLDRIYLNGYVPRLQTSGQVVGFIKDHLGMPVASPAVFEKIGNRFRKEVRNFAKANGIPVLRLGAPDRSRWDDRKYDHVKPYLARAERKGHPAVVAIVATQEMAWVWSAKENHPRPGLARFSFYKAERPGAVYYFYLWDPDFGPGFIKVTSLFPYPLKAWCNGHEWLKAQATKAGLAFKPLANGLASCSDPARLQRLANGLTPRKIQAFFDRWISVIPTPLGPPEAKAGYWWDLSIRQVELATTLVLDDPRRARGFFEALVADNIDIGRPERVSIVFGRRVSEPAWV